MENLPHENINSTRVMGVDLGQARIGIALSDLSGILASPFTTISHKDGSEAAITAIVQIVETSLLNRRKLFRQIQNLILPNTLHLLYNPTNVLA